MISIEASNLLFFIGASLLLDHRAGAGYRLSGDAGRHAGTPRGLRYGHGARGRESGPHDRRSAGSIGDLSRVPNGVPGIKTGGVGYLLFLAWSAVKGKKPSDATVETDRATSVTVRGEQGLFWRGFLMNVLNPKVALFFLAFLPQFVSPDAGSTWAQMLAYGVLFTALVVAIFGTIGILAGRLSGWLGGKRRGGSVRWFGWGVALVYVVLAARLAFV